MLFTRNLFIDEEWESLIPIYTAVGKKYLDVDKYGMISIFSSFFNVVIASSKLTTLTLTFF